MKTKSQYPTAQELEREKLLAGAEAQRKAAALADLGVIGELLEDRESPAGDLSRLVVRRMARLLAELHQPATSGSLARFDHELKGLRALHALLLDSQVLRQQADVIDLHGPRFKIVFDYIMASLKTAMQQVGIHPSQCLAFTSSCATSCP